MDAVVMVVVAVVGIAGFYLALKAAFDKYKGE